MLSKKLPQVSIIITTRNEEKNIGNCLESIKYQTYPSKLIEIIVVDNNSSDGTKKIALQYTKNVFNFGPERSAQRNYGVKKAKSEYILYLDADMILSPTVIEKCVLKLADREMVALYVSEIILGNSYWSRVRRFERSFYDGTVIDCVRFIRKDIFEKVGGFDETMTGPEDWDLDKKIRNIGKTELLETEYKIPDIRYEISGTGYEKLDEKGLKNIISLTSEPVIFHNEADFNLNKYLEKKKYYSKSFNTYINKWGKDDTDIKKQFGFWYRYFGVFIEKGKWKKILKHLLTFLGILFLRVFVGISFAINRIGM